MKDPFVEHAEPPRRRLVRLAGTLMIGSGCLVFAWAMLVWQWQDPFTAIVTHFKQTQLASDYKHRAQSFSPPVGTSTHGVTSLAAARHRMASDARAYERSLAPGDAVGKLTIGRIGLSMYVVQGTDHETLKGGPGHYIGSALPGEGKLIYIAGHRTTYLAPFSHIDDIETGDYIKLSVPYGTFSYRVTRHYIVASTATQVLVDHGREILRLQACHPRFFASHRYLVDARLVAFTPRGGARSFDLAPPTSA